MTQYLCDEVTVVGEMTIDPTHAGQTADIFVWAEATLPPDETLYYFMLEEGKKTILSGDQVPAHLAAFIPKMTLKSVESVTMYQGQFIYPWTLKVFFGYRLSDKYRSRNFLLFSFAPLGEGPGVRENTAEFLLQYLARWCLMAKLRIFK